ASAVGYDYSDDRGFSVLLGTSRDRLAGGLTNELIAEVNAELTRLNGRDAHLQNHYLALPLAFRARGGFGTHWLYAQTFRLHDPRPRGSSGDEQVVIDRGEMEALWAALHDPDKPFCEHALGDPKDTERQDRLRKVQGWVCGTKSADPDGRDLHMANWNAL